MGEAQSLVGRTLPAPDKCEAATATTRPLIVFYADAHVYGGAEHYLATLLAGYDRSRFTSRLVITRWPDMDKLLAEFSQRGLEADIIDASSVKSLWRQFLASFQYFRRVRPDVVHFNRTWNYGFVIPQLAARIAGVHRVILTEHLPEVLSVNRARHCWGLLPGLGLWRWKRILARRISVWNADIVISPTDASRRILREQYRFPESKTTVVPHGVVLPSARHNASRKAVRAELGCDDTNLLIGAVGRLCPQKGFQHLIPAFRTLLLRCPNARLCIAGEGESRDDLQTAIASSGLSSHIRLLGHRSDMQGLFSAFDVFAFPSIFESAGLALMEAMSYGLPVVASNLDEFKGVVEPGITGLLTPPGDATALEAALYTLVTDEQLRTRLARQAQQHIRQHFSVAHCVDRTYALYSRSSS